MNKYVKVKVIPNARKESIKKKTEDNFIITVKEKAEDNMANKRICEVVATLYSVPRSNVKIINGHHKSGKLLILTT